MQETMSHEDFVKMQTAKTVNHAVKATMDAISDDYIDEELIDDEVTGPLNLDIEKIANEAEAAESFDIFSLGQTYVTHGHTVAYTIKKNGKVHAHKEHPYSWKDLQEELGAGTYKVTLRLPEINNKYVKTQSLTVTDIPVSKKANNEDSNVRATYIQPPQNNTPDFDSLMERMERQRKEEREQSKQDAREREELMLKMTETIYKKDENKTDVATVITGLISALSPLLVPILTREKTDSSVSTQTLMLEMQKMNMENQKQQLTTTMELLKAQQEQTRSMFEGLKDTIASIADDRDTGNDGADTMSLMKEIREAEDRGFEKYKLLHDLADEKAREKSGTPAKEESTTDVLLKSAIPMLGMMFSQGKAQQAQVTAPYTPAPAVVHAPEPRRSLHTAPTPTVSRGQDAQRIRSPQIKTSGQPKGFRTAIPSVSHGEDTRKNTVMNNPLVADKNLGTIDHGGALTSKIKDIVIPVIVDAFSNNETDRKKVVERCIAELNLNHVPLQAIGKSFNTTHLDEIIAEFSLPVEFAQTLRELHYELLVATGNVTETRSHA